MNSIPRHSKLWACLVAVFLVSGCTAPVPKPDTAPRALELEQPIQDHQAQALPSELERLKINIFQRSREAEHLQTVQTGRYSSMFAIPSFEQLHPLEVIIEVTIPNDLETIGQGIHYLLRRSGYSINPQISGEVIDLLAKPLPDVHRKLGPVTLVDAISVLTTPHYRAMEDPDSQRRIRFVPTDATQDLNPNRLNHLGFIPAHFIGGSI